MLFNNSNSIQHYSFICTQLNDFKDCYLILIIQFKSFVCTHLNGFKYRKWLNISIWPTNGNQTGTTTPGKSGPDSNSNERVFHISPCSRTGA